MTKTKAAEAESVGTLHAWATVELTDLMPGEPPLEPVRDENGRPVHRIFRRGDIIPLHLFAEYVPSPGMAAVHSGIDDLLEWGSVGWEAPGAEPDPPGDWYEIHYKDGREPLRIQGTPPDPEALQVVSGELIAHAETSTNGAQ